MKGRAEYMKQIPWKYIRFRNLQTRISGYGYQYSFSRYLALLILGMVSMVAIGKLNGLKFVNICILVIAVSVMIPLLLLVQFRYLYEQNRFQDLINYMEQMMYSFQKHPKIVSALEEVGDLVEGDLKFRIQQIQETIESSEAVSYEEAFRTIEVAYPCDRLENMHEFFIKVERIGGQYQTALAVLIEDLKLWVERVYVFQKERSYMKKKIILSIFCVMILCVVLFRMMIQNEEMKAVIDSELYQKGTTLILISFLIIFGISQKVLTGDWLKKTKGMTEEEIKRDWKRVNDEEGEYPRAKKRIQREIEKEFPKWMRIIILNLETENVYRSITESIDDAPYVLKDPLQILVEEIKEDPASMKPYQHFLQQLQIPEIHSSVKMLYAYTNTGADEAKNQLNALMKRNIILTDRAEKMQNEDEIAKYSMIFYLPMFLGTGKVMLDMSVMFMIMFSVWGQFM
jgi:hypothetical protein